MRINKFLAHAGIASRRKIDELIREGKVSVNNQKAKVGQNIDPTKDQVFINNKKIQNQEKLEYIILNKPRGITSSVRDVHAEKTVVDLVETSTRLYPVGRLDKESKGLILLTNDGYLANKLTHPRYHIPKVYEVLFLGKVKDAKIQNMQKGIELEEGKTKESKVKIKTQDEHKTLLEITLFEGRKRQIRRMAEKLRLHILSLKRIAIGQINLGDLEPGKSRKLSDQEVNSLKSSLII